MPSEHPIEPVPQFRFLPAFLLEYQAKHSRRLYFSVPGAPLAGLLYQKVQQMQRSLRAVGISRDQRVAVALPNGPEMAVAALAVAACTACAPLNPAYTAEELDRYFGDLRVITLITEAGTDSPARCVAISRGIRVVELTAEAGLFAIAGGQGSATSDDSVGPEDVAPRCSRQATCGLRLFPRMLTSVRRSAGVGAGALEHDRCLNVMPLFQAWPDCRGASPPGRGCSVVCAGYRPSASDGCAHSDRLGTRRCRRSIKQSWPRRGTMAGQRRTASCASFARAAPLPPSAVLAELSVLSGPRA
jgi:hypothetical protein